MKVSPPSIPVDIILHTLLKLPVKTLIRFQCVCKEWFSIIQDPYFKLSYRGQRRVIVVTERSGWGNLVARSITHNFRVERKFSFGLDDLCLVYEDSWTTCVWCSCNGFVLFNVEEHLLLWNPSIRCCTKVLELQFLRGENYYVASGLCYDSSTEDYKAVLLFRNFSSDSDSKFVLVASLKSKQWREVPFPYNLNSVGEGINFHGIFHCMASDIKLERPQTNYYDYDDSRDGEWDNFSECNKIVYFDPECDEFRDLPAPEPTHVGVEDSIVGLGIVEGCFCMARKVKETEMIEVLVMEKYKMKESWVSKFVIPNSKFGDDYYQRILYSLEKNSKVLIWSWENICAYDLKKNKLNDFLEAPRDGSHIGICFYVESFDSPKGFIWRGDEHEEKIKWMHAL